jgi:2-amino-4-hydroxy-6-hydroxymethyldihydropteridine diphosphokinase
MALAYLLLGSNIGERLDHILDALALLEQRTGRLMRCSSIFETEPWGFLAFTPFLNQVVQLSTRLEPSRLIEEILSVETILGRTRNNGQFESRTIDIDILFYDDLVLKDENLIIPHPRLHLRRFTLVPLAQIAPNLVHPGFNKTIRELLTICPDHLEVTRYRP